MPFGPAWAVAWGGHLQSYCLPALDQTGLWTEGAAVACLGSGCPRLCCGEPGGYKAGPVRNQRLPRSSIPFYRAAGLSLRTVLAGSALLGAAGWGQWSQHLCLSHCCCHLPQSKRRTTWASILERRNEKWLRDAPVGPALVLPSGPGVWAGEGRRLTASSPQTWARYILSVSVTVECPHRCWRACCVPGNRTKHFEMHSPTESSYAPMWQEK